MYGFPNMCQHPFNANAPIYMHQCPYFANIPMYNPGFSGQLPEQYPPYIKEAKASNPIILRDYGPNPFVVNIEEAAKQNNNFRLALWSGKHMQLTLMSINVGEDIGLEIHPDLDQFIRIEEGQGIVIMGDRKDRLDFQANVRDDFAFIIPAGKWHNLINTGNIPLKLYSIYAPPQHPPGTVHKTKLDALAAEESHSH
jgi:mannose-6-phosphate isomerase-like protein (cupin superfamily)